MVRMADIDEMMYRCGMEILHPGGMEKTDEMARRCGVGRDKKVLDIGVGKGVTPCHLAEKYGCSVVGIDLSERMLEEARGRADRMGLSDRVSLGRGDAHNLPFADGTFDVVIIECVTTILDKRKAFSEIHRVLRPGGTVGDLEMIWRERPSKNAERDTFEVWEGFETMMLEGWRELLEETGFIDIETVDFSDTMQDIEKEMRRELGLKGMLKFAGKLMMHGDLRRAWREYERVFREHREYIGYGYFIGRKE
ncbi:MAG: class I SAM-dependent methyltransferase [Thermoplasmata archaeon]